MRISTRTHAFLDFATSGFLLAFPRILGASERLTKATTALALSKLGYTLLTRREGGVVGILPAKVHLALDTVAGTTLATLPFLSKEENEPAVVNCCVALGLFDIAAAAISDPHSRPLRIPGFNTGAVTSLPGEDASPEVAELLPETTLLDTLKVHLGVTVPTVAVGPITLRSMRDEYGSGPLMVDTTVRNQAVLLDPADMRRVLEGSPEPFATAEVTKQAALAHFEPRMSLVSHGPERTIRRRLNEDVLEMHNAIHGTAKGMLPIVDEEAQALLELVELKGELIWDDFEDAWFRIVRRIVFGNSARDDQDIIDTMKQLRADGNKTFLKPVNTELRDELHQRIQNYLQRAEQGSLAAVMSSRAQSAVSAPENQIPQWLFAFDPAGMSTFRALALLATHPEQLERAREETADGVAAARPHRPFLRACILETLRLWPTTPAILRQSTRETQWENGVMPAHTSILIYAPYFHRDETRVPFAHTFHPDVWIEDDPEVKGNMPRNWPFVPFSGGPAVCPGRNLVLLLTSGMLAALLGKRAFRLQNPNRLKQGDLPGMLDHFTLRFDVAHRFDSEEPHPSQRHFAR